MAKKKKKVRVAFRKNRENRPRAQNLTRRVLDSTGEAERLKSVERISGKGDLTRFRTVIATEDSTGGEFQLDVDIAKCLSGRVLSSAGLASVVQTADGTRYECSVRRVLQTLLREGRNAVVAGDRVYFLPGGDQQGVIERVEPRHGVLARESQRKQHVIVANCDQVLIVVSADSPQLKPGVVDRLLISAETGRIRPLICINKADLVDPAALQPITGQYGRLGYDVVLTSAATSKGIARLRSLMKDRQTVLTGQSGVGKSSLLNALQPGLSLRTLEISKDSRKGRHSTRLASLMQLDFGGWVVDTPGVRQLSLWDVIPEEVEGYFVEFRPLVPYCKFPDCSHTHETGCFVKKAVEQGLISQLRYESYQHIISGD